MRHKSLHTFSKKEKKRKKNGAKVVLYQKKYNIQPVANRNQ
jgi:hypothetical protein